MAEAKGYTPRTYEELLMGRLGKLFDAKEEGNGYLFDEVLDEIEGLFALAPAILNTFLIKKNEHGHEADEALSKMKMELNTLNADDITKEVLKTQKIAIIQWEYRSDVMDDIISILNDYQMIPYQTGIASAEMDYGELTEEETIEPPAPPLPPPAQAKPVPKVQQRPVEQYPNPIGSKPVPPPSVPEPPEEEPSFTPAPPIPKAPPIQPAQPAQPVSPAQPPAELKPIKRIKPPDENE